jgi:O-antigen/teichoic acid export membrane protein
VTAGAPALPRTLRRIAGYGAARVVVEIILGVRGLALAAVLGPVAFGGWALMRLATGYASFGTLGIHRGLELELTRARGLPAAHDDRARPDAAALAYLLAVFGLLAVGALAASFVVQDPARMVELRIFGAAVLGEQLYGYGLVALRVRADLGRYARLELAHAGLQLVCTCVPAWAWGLNGALAGMVIGNLLSVGVVIGHVPLRPRFAPAVIRRLLGIGLPFAVTMWLGRLLGSVDRLVVAADGGRSALGYYAFAVSIAGLAATLGWVVRVVIFPDVYARAQAVGAGPAVREHVARALLPFAVLYPPLLGIAALALRPGLALIAPQYAAASAAAEVFVFSGVAGGLTSLGAVGALAGDRQRWLPAMAAGSVALNLVLSHEALRLGLGLEGVAAGAVISQTAYGLGVLGLNLRVGGQTDPVAALARAAVPLLWCAASVAAVRAAWPGAGAADTAQAVLAYAALMLPLARPMTAALRAAGEIG